MVRDLLTLPPWVREEQFRDIDSQAAQYRGYGQEYQQLSRGAFAGRVISFDFSADLVVHIESANQDIAVAASTPSSRLGLCLLTESSPHCTFNGATLTPDHLMMSPRGNGFVGKTAAGFNIYCMDLSRDLLPAESDHWSGADILYDPKGAQTMREVVESGLTTLVRLQSIEQYSATFKAFESSVADALCQIVTRTATDPGQSAPHCARPRTLRLLRVAQEYIHNYLNSGISVVEICKHTGTNRRAVERTFQSVLGMGPAAYIRNLQLNRVRRDLLSGDKDGVSIGDIAAHYGIWHLSRFSQNYQRLFGELPSQTRIRLNPHSIA